MNETRIKRAQERARRIRKKYAKMRSEQPLATKTAILSVIAIQEKVTIPTCLRAVNGDI